MSVHVTVSTDPRWYAPRVAPLLQRDPIAANVLSAALGGVLSGRRRYPDALWISLDEAGRPLGAAMLAPPNYLFLTPLPAGAAPQAAALLSTALAELGRTVPGVSGTTPEASAFAHAYAERCGVTARLVMSQRMYQLLRLRPPADVPGAARPAVPADRTLLVAWLMAFDAEAGEGMPVLDVEEIVARNLVQRTYTLWCDAGQPVSLASTLPPASGVARIGPVYTPPEHRRHGYAAAVTAAASELGFRQGADRCMLYTDLANPTSNALYQRLGYLPVADAAQYAFG